MYVAERHLLNEPIVFREEAAESDVVPHVLVTVSAAGHDQHPVSHRVALSGVAVVHLGQQGGDAHHLRVLRRLFDFVLPRRQHGAEDYGGHHEDGGHSSQGGDGDEAVDGDGPGGAGLDLGGCRALCGFCGARRWSGRWVWDGFGHAMGDDSYRSAGDVGVCRQRRGQNRLSG